MRSVPRSIEQPEKTTDVNVRGTLNVLLAARDVGATVVFASSSSVYGDQESFPLREGLAPLLRSPYAASKLAGEAYCRAWWLSFAVPTVSLRYFNVYGPGQDPMNEYAAVVPRFVMACLDGTAPEVHGDGEQSRDFTYIDDAVDANLLAAVAPEQARGRVLNVGGGREPTSVNTILEIVARLTATNPRPKHTPSREGDVRRTEADVSLARQLIGYDPKVDIEEGLLRTVAWFRQNVAHPAEA
jgi:nucleoside-diphosphate-sugar epimerase